MRKDVVLNDLIRQAAEARHSCSSWFASGWWREFLKCNIVFFELKHYNFLCFKTFYYPLNMSLGVNDRDVFLKRVVTHVYKM